MAVSFEAIRCDKNPYCPVTGVCPTGALHIDRKTFRPTFDPSKCTGCAICVPSCPHGALSDQ